MNSWVLVTGGAGYVGSHVAVALLSAGRRVLVLDNFENAPPDAIERIAAVGAGRPALEVGDVRDPDALDRAFSGRTVDAVVHAAGLKAVGESAERPLRYYDSNVCGAVRLLEAMDRHSTRSLVFSSSATVYGAPERLPLREDARTGPTNPYGRTKLMIEQIIDDHATARAGFRAISLRYFNPVGAHPSAEIGEDPRGVPNNLFPYIAQTAAGMRDRLRIFGADYETPDGTGVRDYIHVVDLAEGHLAAIERLERDGTDSPRHRVVNLGTGRGYSVMEALRAFSRACGADIPHEVVARRPGDVAACVADPSLAAELLDWSARRGLEAMCQDHWRFQRRMAAAASLAAPVGGAA